MHSQKGEDKDLQAGGCTATVLIRSVSSQLVALKLSHSTEYPAIKLWNTDDLRQVHRDTKCGGLVLTAKLI